MALLNKSKLRPEDRSWIRDTIVRATAGMVSGGLRVDLDRLDEGEQAWLLRLVEQESKHGFSLARLGRSDRNRLEGLIERGAGLEAGYFDAARNEDRQRRDQADADASRRRRPFSKTETQSFFRTVHGALASGDLWIDDVAMLCLLLSILASGETYNTPGSRLEGGGEDVTIILDSRWGLVGRADGAGTLDSLLDRLVFLGEEQWLIVKRPGGPMWRIKPGKRLLAALGGEVFELPDEEREVVVHG